MISFAFVLRTYNLSDFPVNFSFLFFFFFNIYHIAYANSTVKESTTKILNMDLVLTLLEFLLVIQIPVHMMFSFLHPPTLWCNFPHILSI